MQKKITGKYCCLLLFNRHFSHTHNRDEIHIHKFSIIWFTCTRHELSGSRSLRWFSIFCAKFRSRSRRLIARPSGQMSFQFHLQACSTAEQSSHFTLSDSELSSEAFSSSISTCCTIRATEGSSESCYDVASPRYFRPRLSCWMCDPKTMIPNMNVSVKMIWWSTPHDSLFLSIPI